MSLIDSNTNNHLLPLREGFFQEAEKAGWDGVFLWDHVLYKSIQSPQIVDPWVSLTAMAMVTNRLHLGTTVTPLVRRRPWKLARETVTLDHLSNGRLILGPGLGHPGPVEFSQFGEDEDDRVRAARLDEGLASGVAIPFLIKAHHHFDSLFTTL